MVGLKFKHKVKRKILYDLIQSQQITIDALCKRIHQESTKKDYYKTVVDEARKEKLDQLGQIPPAMPEMKKLDLHEALTIQSKFDLQEAMREEGEKYDAKAMMHKEALEEYEKYIERESSP